MVQQLLPQRTEQGWADMRAEFLARLVECSLCTRLVSSLTLDAAAERHGVGEVLPSEVDWWAVRGSNPRPPRCKRGALTS
jgi:hypothetical protein